MLNFSPDIYLVKFKKFCQFLCILFFPIAFAINHVSAQEATSSGLIDSNRALSSQAALKFKHLLSADGLSQNNVFDITQDHDGFIWIATEDGLNRYDGKNFVHYSKNLADPNSIADNFIRKVFIDNDGVLWAGTANGLSKYNNELDSFENYYHQEGSDETLIDNVIWDIYQDNSKDKNLWVSTTNGIHKYNKANNHFKQIKIHGFEDKLKEIKTIYQDLQGNFWFGSYENGIFLVNENFDYFESLQKKDNKWHITIPSNSLFDMKEINDHYWLATDAGVYVLDENRNLITHYHTASPTHKIISDKVRSIVLSDDSTIWVGTENGLNVIDLNSKTISLYQNNQISSSLSKNKILSIIKDVTGNLWVGTYGKGINLFFNSSLNFKHYSSGVFNNSIDSIIETTDGQVWFYSENSGLNNITNKTSDININIPEGVHFQLKSDSKNNLWINTYPDGPTNINSDELFVYNVTSNQTKKIKDWKEKSLYNRSYPFQLFNNKVWFIDTGGTLSTYNISTNQFYRYSTKDNEPLKTFDIDERNNTIWATSLDNQLLSFDLSQNSSSITHHALNGIKYLSTIKITSIKVSDSWVWLTSRQGILLYNKKTKFTTYFNENNKLLSHSIDSAILDNQENAWFSTNGAISFINPKTQKVTNFSKDFYLSDIEFIERSALKATNNEFYFGGSKGIHKFTPQKVVQISQKLNLPKLTELRIANQEVTVKNQYTPTDEGKFFLEKPLSQLSNLTLKHQQSPFSIGFISPTPKSPDQIGYRYRLLGLETEWIDAGKDNYRATYTNLSAGDYVFEVEVYDLLGTVPSKKANLNIHILAPWWLSKTAIIVYGLLCLLAITYVFQQMRHKRLFHLQIQKSEERLKLSLWGSGDEMWDWNIVTGKIYRSNIWGILEFPQDGKRNVGSDKTNINEHDISRVREAINDHFDNDTDHFEATYRVKNKDNKWIWVLDRGKIVERDDKGNPSRMTGTLKDISRIKKADERLKLFAKCIENISDAVVIYDRLFNIVDVNKSFQRITKKSKKDMIGQSLNFDQYPESFSKDVKRHLITKGSWYGEIENKRDNGEAFLTDLNIDVILDENQAISHFVGVFSDITKRKETEAELRKLANSDTLTGLPNRSYFQANQTLLVNQKVPHALLVFDLDNFKKINDSMGHEVGDVLLCQVAKRMRSVGRKQDTVYRLGGDEFSIIIENTNDIHTITSIAKEVLSTIAQPLKLKNQEVVLFSSLGIVLYPEDGASPQELLKNADTAMYHAKNNGGNKYQFFSDSMNKAAVKRLQVESLIRHGLKEDAFSVFYQPKIEIATGKVAGMEALVRFETPKKGIISPVTFIPVSEETGQIIEIGEVVLRKSCIATKKWVDAGLFSGRVAVNLSAVQFTQPNLVGMIADILKESQLPAKYLELEITEGTVMDSPQRAIDTMLQIRAMGIHLSLDDFGTGYSSLAYLKKFPLNTLKIDKAFVDDIEESEQGRNMVATIVTIAHNLGMQVVAEGVETNQQLSFLSGLRCEQLQGYLYSKPLPENDFQKYLLSYQITKASTSFGKASR